MSVQPGTSQPPGGNAGKARLILPLQKELGATVYIYSHLSVYCVLSNKEKDTLKNLLKKNSRSLFHLCLSSRVS